MVDILQQAVAAFAAHPHITHSLLAGLANARAGRQNDHILPDRKRVIPQQGICLHTAPNYHRGVGDSAHIDHLSHHDNNN